MRVLTVTRFRLRSAQPFGHALFLLYSWRSGRQAKRTPGFLGGRMLMARDRSYWTVTLWEDAASMHAFRDRGAHRSAMNGMAVLDTFCDEAATATRHVTGDALPADDELHHLLVERARWVELRRPSPDHAAGRVAPPTFLGGSTLRPRRSWRTARA